MKLFSLCFLLFFLISTSFAEENIGILQFQSKSNVDSTYINSIEQLVHQVFVDDRRFNIVERSNLNAIDAERIIQDMRNVSNLSQIKDTGVSYIVVGEINAAEVSKIRLESGGYSFKANLNFGLKVIDVSTGTIINSGLFGPRKKFSLFRIDFASDTSTPLGAVAAALKESTKSIKSFVADTFPIQAELVSIEKTKRSKAEKVLIAAGSEQGMEKKMKLVAFQVQNISVGGKTMAREKQISELIIERVEGENFSLCKVKSNGKELQSLVDSGQQIFVKVVTD